MAAPKVTAVVDKDLGQVFGAVLELNATDKLPVGSVAASGFLLRRDEASGLLPNGLVVPFEELDTLAVANTAVLKDPNKFVVASGAAASGVPPSDPAVGQFLAKSNGTDPVTVNFRTSVSVASVGVKVVYNDNTAGESHVLPLQKLDNGATATTEWTLQAPALKDGHEYDLLLLVEKHTYLLKNGIKPT